MRELAATGFMSNRGRQNVASYLVLDLGLDWRAGAWWFEVGGWVRTRAALWAGHACLHACMHAKDSTC